MQSLKTIPLLLCFFCQSALPVDPSGDLAGGLTGKVRQFVEAFNQKDVDAMLFIAAEDMSWMSISNQKLELETASRAKLRESMLAYFKSTPSARSEIRSIHESGPFVYSLEQAFWAVKGKEKSQCSMAVYEFSDDKIRNVWYFPSHECP